MKTIHRQALVALAAVLASGLSAHAAATIQITSPQDQSFANPTGGPPDLVDVTSQVTGNIGRRTGMADASGSTVYGYDRRGLPTREEKTIGSATYVTQYAYDKTGNLTQILYPTDNPGLRQGRADYIYDAADRVTAKVNGATTTVASSIGYKPFGPRTSLTFGNGLVDSRTYGTRYQLGTWTLGSLLNYTHVFNNDLKASRVARAAEVADRFVLDGRDVHAREIA